MENGTMTKTTCILMAAGLLAVGVMGYLTSQAHSGNAAQGQTGTDKQPSKENTADSDAIKKAGQSFLKAYLAGDAKAMAAHWTENGEYFTDDGTILRGRANIEQSYAELFAKTKPYAEAAIEVTSIRFPSKDTAIEEGYFKVRKGKEGLTASKYSVLHVREGGKWLMAVVREWPSEGVTLHDLEWLIGTWEAKRDNTEVRTTYEWWGDKTYIRVQITVKRKDSSVQGFQMIGKDRSTGQLRSWTFDPDGSFSEATWSRDGKKWMVDTAAVMQDGSVQAATNIITWIDDNTFTFQSVERTVDGEQDDDIAPVRVTRVKTK
jgi:uncharacterized protein (TIGR02246 family)